MNGALGDAASMSMVNGVPASMGFKLTMLGNLVRVRLATRTKRSHLGRARDRARNSHGDADQGAMHGEGARRANPTGWQP